jgi:uncharacterized protein (DUF1778 family)
MKNKNTFVQFRAEPELKKAITEAAQAQGLTISDFLRQMVGNSKECHKLAA